MVWVDGGILELVRVATVSMLEHGVLLPKADPDADPDLGEVMESARQSARALSSDEVDLRELPQVPLPQKVYCVFETPIRFPGCLPMFGFFVRATILSPAVPH